MTQQDVWVSMTLTNKNPKIKNTDKRKREKIAQSKLLNILQTPYR